MFGANAYAWPYWAQAYAGAAVTPTPTPAVTDGGSRRTGWETPRQFIRGHGRFVARAPVVDASGTVRSPQRPLVTLGDTIGASMQAWIEARRQDDQDDEDLMVLL